MDPFISWLSWIQRFVYMAYNFLFEELLNPVPCELRQQNRAFNHDSLASFKCKYFDNKLENKLNG